jgi:hypothetical protein
MLVGSSWSAGRSPLTPDSGEGHDKVPSRKNWPAIVVAIDLHHTSVELCSV